MRHSYTVSIYNTKGDLLASETGSNFERTVGYLYKKHRLGRGRVVMKTDWTDKKGEWPIGTHFVQMGRSPGGKRRHQQLDQRIIVEVEYASWFKDEGNDSES